MQWHGSNHACTNDGEEAYVFREINAKDYDDLSGRGLINFKEVRRAVDDIGYRSWIQMEGVKVPLGIERSCRYDLAYLRSIFPEKA